MITATTQRVRRRRAPETLWYAPDRRIRTKAAALQAREIAARIVSGAESIEDGDAHTLFKALQTCAFQAAQPARGKHISQARRRRWARRWKVVRDHIVDRNLPLVRWLVMRVGSACTDSDALLSEGFLALVHSVERFNPWLGYCFSTYATNAIIRAMMRLKKRESRYRSVFPVQHDASFERPTRPESYYTGLCVERLSRILNANTGGLTSLEAQVIAGHFGLKKERRMTLQEIGETVGLSKERIRQIQRRAIHKLRDALASDPVLQ